MSLPGVGSTDNIIALDAARLHAGGSNRGHTARFEETLTVAEHHISGEIVPLPQQSPPFPPSTLYGHLPSKPLSETETSDIDSYFNEIESRIAGLEHDLLSLRHQISALIRCL